MASSMLAVLTQSGLKKALLKKKKKPEGKSDVNWNDLDEKALTVIQLCLSNEVLQEVLLKKTTSDMWRRVIYDKVSN